MGRDGEEYKRFEGEKTLEQWGILTNERMIIWEEKWRYHQTLEEDERLEERQRLREERIRIWEEESNEYVKHMTKIYEKRIIQVQKRNNKNERKTKMYGLLEDQN